mmetsp:Transcript_29021/g.86130  ORF Transcript_29021/g.86130 Transcript_29021/m.86130 type:complete len:200 (-) Transcript_29021:50-649(-)
MSSSNFFRLLSSSLKASVTKTSQSFLASFSFLRSLSSTICCSTFRRSVASITFSMYFAWRELPVATFSAPSGTHSPTRFFWVSTSVRTCWFIASRPCSSLTSSMTSSYWKTVGSSATSSAASRSAFFDCSVFVAQEGGALPLFFVGSSSSSSMDCWKSAETPPEAAAAALGLAAPKLKPPLNAPVFSGPSFIMAACSSA